MRKTTKVIVGSALTMAMCATLITGATLALFTDQADVNLAVSSGKVEVAASVNEDTIKTYLKDDSSTGSGKYVANAGIPATSFALGGSVTYDGAGDLTITNIGGGEGFSFNLVITNKSTISIKYQVRLTAKKDGSSDNKLADALRADFQFDNSGDTDPTFNMTQMQLDDTGGKGVSSTYTLASEWKKQAATADSATADGEKIATVPIGIWLPTTVGNEYKDASCTLTISVLAYQANAHLTDPPVDGAIPIYNEYEFCALSSNPEALKADAKIQLMNNIYLNGAARTAARLSAYVVADSLDEPAAPKFEPIGDAEHPFQGTFNGNNYTIFGLKAEGDNAGLFGVTENATIENLTIAGANVEATASGAAGVLVGTAKGSLNVSGVKVQDSTVTAAAEATNTTLGALVGKSEGEGATVTVKDVDVQLSESDTELGNSALVGGGEGQIEYPADSETTLELDLSDGFVEKITNPGADKQKKWYEVSTAAGLTYFAKTVNGTTGEVGAAAKDYAGLTVSLMNDIDLKNEPWTPIGTKDHPFTGTFDGTKSEIENYTISNLTYKNEDQSNVGFFGGVNGTVKNLVFSKANITAQGQCGVLAGSIVGGTISGITIQDGNVTATGNNVGGLAGSGNGTIQNITISKTNVMTPLAMSGGLVGEGYAFFSQITVSECTVQGNTKVGGVIGQWQEGDNQMTNVTVSNSTAYGQQNVSMLVGYLNYGDKTFDTCSIESCTIEAKSFSTTPANFLSFGGFVGTANMPTDAPRTISFNACKIDAGKELTFKGSTINGVGGFIGGTEGNKSTAKNLKVQFSGGTTCNVVLEKSFANAGIFVGNFSFFGNMVTFDFGADCSGAGYIGSKDSGNHFKGVIGKPGTNIVIGNPTIS